MNAEIEYAKRILQRLPVIVKGLKAQQEQIEDAYTEFHVDPFKNNEETRDALKELKAIDLEIARYTEHYENAVAFLEEKGVDPFPQTWFQKMKTKRELNQMLPEVSILKPKNMIEKIVFRMLR